MMARSLHGRLLGHLCGLTGTTIAIDGIFGKFFDPYAPLFPYRDGGFLIAVLMIALGCRVVRENLPRRLQGPWRR